MIKSKTPLDRTFDALLGREIQKLSSHLPKQRQPLSDLLGRKDPTIEAADGSLILLKSVELEQLAKIVPEEYHARLKLPIILLRRMDLGRSLYSVAGERLEEFTVKKILGMTDLDYHQMYLDKEVSFLYRPQVSELIRLFHSLVVIGFGVPKELLDYVPKRD